MKSIRTTPTVHAAEGDERIRTAVCDLGAISTIRSALHLLTAYSHGEQPDVAEVHETSLQAYADLRYLEFAIDEARMEVMREAVRSEKQDSRYGDTPAGDSSLGIFLAGCHEYLATTKQRRARAC